HARLRFETRQRRGAIANRRQHRADWQRVDESIVASPWRKTMSEMIYRTLGATGVKVSAIGVGGWHIGLPKVDEPLSLRIIRTALDRGINFLDNSWDYNDGVSETRMGKALKDGYRDKAFLMTKIDGRTKEEAAKQLDESL